MLLWCSLLIVISQSSLVSLHRKNVCPTIMDYATIATNKNCWYNADVDSSPTVIAKRYGYPMKKYRVTTEDGYILTLFRIPHNGSDPNSSRQPVLVQHGIAASAIFWMLQGQKSLAFFLSNNGYDVWLSTSRGASYSRKHVYLTTENPAYWNFGIHELGVYDLPANIEFISNITGQKGNIIYIGHSMGSTMSYIYSSVKKDHANSHLKAMISLSPVAYMKHIEGWYKLIVPLVNIAATILPKFGINYVGDMPPINDLVYSFCSTYPGVLLCQAVTFIITGMEPSQIKPDIIPPLTRFYPAGTSLKVLNHFTQMVLSNGKFQHFDYKLDNMVVYNSVTPPAYNVADISLPIYLFIGTQDVLASERDVDILYEKLNSSKSGSRASKHIFNFAHNDFFLGADLKDFYTVLKNVLKNETINT